MRYGFFSTIFLRTKGNASPAKLLPPPAQPMMTSGSSPACSICLMASWPMTVWCMQTWFSTLPSEYLVLGVLTASSMASLMAMPRLPAQCGFSCWILRPNSVWSLGLE